MVDRFPVRQAMNDGRLIQALSVQGRKQFFERRRKKPIERSFLQERASAEPKISMLAAA